MNNAFFWIGIFLILFGLAGFWFLNAILCILILLLGGVFVAAGFLDGAQAIGILIGVLIPVLIVAAVLSVL